jgi:hypothetical protein
MPSIKKRTRPTIMDGLVVDFSESFIDGDPSGLHVSASRNCVIVHRAIIRSAEDAQTVIEAIQAAVVDRERLRRGQEPMPE